MCKENSLSAKRNGAIVSEISIDIIALKEEYLQLCKNSLDGDPDIFARMEAIEKIVGENMANDWNQQAIKLA